MTFNFIHFSIQLFLAAPHEELQVLKERFWSEFHLTCSQCQSDAFFLMGMVHF